MKQPKLLAITLISLIVVAISASIYTNLIQNDITGTARVINYSGLVRGATQRLVKLEITNNPNDQLLLYVDGILNELQSDEMGQYQLIKLEDNLFQNELLLLTDIWEDMLEQIEITRSDGYESSTLLKLSEEHFLIADNAVHLAETYADTLLQKMEYAKLLLIATIILLVITLILVLSRILALKTKNKQIEEFSHIDLPTNLANKSRCHQVFSAFGNLDIATEHALIMFDLNYLKLTNDRLGHKAGDELIVNFATILKKNADHGSFIGRFGGDEFVVTYEDTNRQGVEAYIQRVELAVQQFNSITKEPYSKISFAVGYALSNFIEHTTYYTLFEEADINMYKNKAMVKKAIQEQELSAVQ